MGESFIDRHDRDRSTRGRQLDHVAQGIRDLRAVDEQVSVIPIEEDTEAGSTSEFTQEQQNPEDRSDVDYLRSISKDVDHLS